MLLLNQRLRDLVDPEKPALRDLMDGMDREAESRGLTPEILDSILKDEDSD